MARSDLIAAARPWEGEPDRKEWRHAGLPCLIVRNDLGALCGYAGVPPHHPLHGKDAHEVDLVAHGGVNYADFCHGRICHVPQPGEPRHIYWFGFDCAHGWDLVPALDSLMSSLDGVVYRDMAYVTRVVEQLAEQLAALSNAGGHHAA